METLSKKRLITMGAGLAIAAYFWSRKKAEAFRASVHPDVPQNDDAADPSADGSMDEQAPAGRGDGDGRASASNQAAVSGDATNPSAEQTEPLNQTLFEYLSGDVWLDAREWQNLWDEHGGDPEAWVLNDGAAVLDDVRRSLVTQPALLSGCRRRWLVVCRHANISQDVALRAWRS